MKIIQTLIFLHKNYSVNLYLILNLYLRLIVLSAGYNWRAVLSLQKFVRQEFE